MRASCHDLRGVADRGGVEEHMPCVSKKQKIYEERSYMEHHDYH